MRMRAHVDATSGFERRRAHVVDEHEGADRTRLQRGNGAAYLEATQVVNAWGDDQRHGAASRLPEFTRTVARGASPCAMSMSRSCHGPMRVVRRRSVFKVIRVAAPPRGEYTKRTSASPARMHCTSGGQRESLAMPV